MNLSTAFSRLQQGPAIGVDDCEDNFVRDGCSERVVFVLFFPIDKNASH